MNVKAALNYARNKDYNNVPDWDEIIELLEALDTPQCDNPNEESKHSFPDAKGNPFCIKCGIYQCIHPDFGNTECKPELKKGYIPTQEEINCANGEHRPVMGVCTECGVDVKGYVQKEYTDIVKVESLIEKFEIILENQYYNGHPAEGDMPTAIRILAKIAEEHFAPIIEKVAMESRKKAELIFELKETTERNWISYHDGVYDGKRQAIAELKKRYIDLHNGGMIYGIKTFQDKLFGQE